MKFSRLMFVFSGVHLRTRRDSFFLSIHQAKQKTATFGGGVALGDHTHLESMDSMGNTSQESGLK